MPHNIIIGTRLLKPPGETIVPALNKLYIKRPGRIFVLNCWPVPFTVPEHFIRGVLQNMLHSLRARWHWSPSARDIAMSVESSTKASRQESEPALISINFSFPLWKLHKKNHITFQPKYGLWELRFLEKTLIQSFRNNMHMQFPFSSYSCNRVFLEKNCACLCLGRTHTWFQVTLLWKIF